MAEQGLEDTVPESVRRLFADVERSSKRSAHLTPSSAATDARRVAASTSATSSDGESQHVTAYDVAAATATAQQFALINGVCCVDHGFDISTRIM